MRAKRGEPAAEEGPKVPITFRLPRALLADARAVVAELGGLPQQMTMDAFGAEAFRRYLEHLRRTLGAELGTKSRGRSPRRGRPLKLIR
jgi:hypothetical protein